MNPAIYTFFGTHAVNKDDRWMMKYTNFEILKAMVTSYSHTGQIQEALDISEQRTGNFENFSK